MKYLAPLAAVLVLTTGIPSEGADAIQLKAQPQPPAAAPGAAPGATAPAPAPAADPMAAVQRLSVGDAKKAVDAGKAVIVDVNSLGSYAAEHAKGSLSIPANEMYARTGELPKDKQIIAYCSCSAEQTSARVVVELKRQGFDAVALLGGLKAWKEAGYEVESKPAP